MEDNIQIKRDGKNIHFSGEVLWMHTQDRASGHFLAACPSLNIFLEAETREELFSLIPESMDALFKNVIKHNELPQFLKEHGWEDENITTENIYEFPRINIKAVSLHDFNQAACC